MKVRSDFVSNSSSCSFVISSSSGTVADGMKFYADTFADCDIPYDIEDKLTVSLHVKNKWYREVYEAAKGERCEGWSDYYSDWQHGKSVMKDPEEVGWDGIVVGLDGLARVGAVPGVAEKVDSVRFQCEDGDSAAIMYLRLLYAFFERNMFCPDAGESEHGFVRNTPDDEFMSRLTATCREGCGDGE